MNNPATLNPPAIPTPATRLLDAIKDIKLSVGDGLSDDELTRLLQQSALPAEAGFGFLSFTDRVVTLSVPPQGPADWYPEKGWVMAVKEKAARSIGEKYGLMLCEPPDALFTCYDTTVSHHHLELGNQRETIITIHPRYLKIRLFVGADAARSTRLAQKPLSLGPELLQDLSVLYQP
jgi:hypothetical protein